MIDRIWGIWGSYYNIPKAIFYLLKGDSRGTIAWPLNLPGLKTDLGPMLGVYWG